jgi:hypothetical protein
MPKTNVHYKVLFLLSTNCLGFSKNSRTVQENGVA